MGEARRGEALGAALVAITALAIAAPGAFARAASAPSTVATALAFAFVPYALLLASPIPRALERSSFLPLALAAVVGLFLVASPPVLSDDVFRYAWDGAVTRAGIDPYAYAPDDPALAPLRDAAWLRVNHSEIPTIYPPVAIGLFAIFGALGGGIWPFKLLALLGHLACIPAVAALAPEASRDRARLLYALHPLALVETGLEGHVDAVAGFGLALAVLALARGRAFRASACAAIAVGTKLVGLLLVPLVARRSRAAAAGLVMIALVCFAPLVTAGSGTGVPGGLNEYARRWQGNGAIYAAVEASIAGTLRTIAGGGATTLRLGPLAGLPGLRESRAKKHVVDSSRVAIDRVAGLGARALLGLVVLGAALAFARRDVAFASAARATLLVALLCSPQVHPWYLLWLLPLELAVGGLAGQAWSAAVLVAYAPLDRWVTWREWHAPVFALGAELFVVALVVAWELRSRRLAR